jgi:hypothetical protein
MTLAGLRGRDCTRIADRHTRLGVVQTTVRCRPSCPAQRRLPDIPGGCRRRDVTPLPKPLTPPWCLHDHPDRSVDEHAMFCACATCEAAIHAQAAIIPGASIGLKTAADRIVVTLEYLDEVTGDAGRPHPRAADVRARRPCPLILMPVDWWMASRSRCWSWTRSSSSQPTCSTGAPSAACSAPLTSPRRYGTFLTRSPRPTRSITTATRSTSCASRCGAMEASTAPVVSSDDDGRPVERCECHVTYRGPTHGELRAHPA